MPKCIICQKEATHVIKGTSDYYCEDDAQDCFSDITMLQTVEEQAQQLKQALNQHMDQLEEELGKLDEMTGQEESKD